MYKVLHSVYHQKYDFFKLEIYATKIIHDTESCLMIRRSGPKRSKSARVMQSRLYKINCSGQLPSLVVSIGSIYAIYRYY